MKVTLDVSQLRDIMRVAALLGAQQAMVQSGKLSPYLTQNAAYKLYGRRLVANWIKEGKIIAYKSGDKNSKVLINRLELETLVKSDELIVYFKHAA